MEIEAEHSILDSLETIEENILEAGAIRQAAADFIKLVDNTKSGTDKDGKALHVILDAAYFSSDIKLAFANLRTLTLKEKSI